MAITQVQVEAAYAVAKREYGKAITSEAAANHLVSKYRWNESSAYGYVHTFLCMMDGKEYQRTINAYATEYYLRNIRSDFGFPRFQCAISAVKKHLEYYIKKGKSKQYKIQAIIKKLENEFFVDNSLEVINKDFQKQVYESLSLNKETRDKRLEVAPKKPESISVTIKVYVRNPDVVAAVLARAKGVCEGCKKPAPFIRAKDNSPYLEVHHKIQLAKGGEDTVLNAIALCPNCHREYHYGI